MSLFKSFCGFLTTIYIAQPHQGDSFPVRLFDLMHLAPPLLLAAAPAVYTDASWDLNCLHRAGEKNRRRDNTEKMDGCANKNTHARVTIQRINNAL